MANLRVNVIDGTMADIRLMNDAGDVVYIELSNRGRMYLYNSSEGYIGRLDESEANDVLNNLYDDIQMRITR